MLGKVGPAVGGFLGARAGLDELKQDPEQIAQQYADLKANMPQYGVGSAFNEYLAMSKQDPAADMQRQIAAEQEASSIGALKSGGAKALLGGLGASQRQAARQRMGIEADSAARQQSALAAYGAQQQRVQDMNTGMEQRLLQSQFQAERGAEQYNRQLEAQRKQAMGQALGAVAGQFGQGNFKDFFGGDDQAQPPQVSGLLATLGSLKSGGMMTEGAFSHENNPIDIMQDGAKVGEMTGGEAILNPEQQNKVAKQSPYFRKLMREFAMKNRK